MKDIALAAGVDSSTVSLALRGDPRISEATRTKVREVAERLGYRRDPALSALAESRWHGEKRVTTGNLGIMGGWGDADANRKGQEFQLCRSHAEPLGYSLIPLSFGQNSHARMLNRQLSNLNICGVIVDELFLDHNAPWDEVDWDLAAWVGIREGEQLLPIHRVMFNPFQSACVGLERVREAGYQRILFVHDPFAHNRILHRQRAAFLVTQAQWPDVAWATCTMDDLEEVVKRFKPDSFLATFPSMAEQVASRTGLPFASMGLSKEGDPSGICGSMNDISSRSYTAVHFLDSLVRRGDRGLPALRETVMLDSEWVEGDSL